MLIAIDSNLHGPADNREVNIDTIVTYNAPVHS